MKKIGYLISHLLFACLLSACAAVNSVQPFDREQAAILIKQSMTRKPAQQMIALSLPHPHEWKPSSVAAIQNGYPVRLIPQNENRENWQQSIQTSIFTYKKTPDLTAAKLFQANIQQAQTHCRENKIKILSQSAQYIVYRLESSECQLLKQNQIQISKTFNGIDAVYQVRYVILLPYASSVLVNQMTSAIADATLVSDPRYKTSSFFFNHH